MAALIEYVCTAPHDRREEPTVTGQQGSWAFEALRSPAGNGHPRLVPGEGAEEPSSRRRKR
jgi:hypothetical protein